MTEARFLLDDDGVATLELTMRRWGVRQVVML